MGSDTFVEQLPLTHIESGLAGEKAQFLFKTWRENRGLMIRDSRMTKLSPWLLLTLPEAGELDVPNVTFAGRQTTLQRFFPHALDSETDKNPSLFLPQAYRRGVADGYQHAIAGEPRLDIQRTGDRLGAGVPDMTLQRLLVKFETEAGFVRIFCLMELLAVHGQCGRLDHTHHPRNFQQTPNSDPAFRAGVLPRSGHDGCIWKNRIPARNHP